MDAKEIQIGDWVRLVADGDNEILQVTYVREDGVGFKKYSVYFDEVEPIQLTTKILEQNGFEYSEDDEFFYVTDGVYIRFELEERDNDFVFGDFCTIKYVHQLQQLLRLCGLTNLADNFKIK